MSNCSNVPPLSNVYFKEVTVTEKVFIGIVTVLCFLVLLLFFDKARFLYSHYGNHGRPKSIRDKSILLVAIYPVASASSLLALYIPRAHLLSDFVSTVYVAICLYQFTSLIVLYFGGKATMIEKTSTSGFMLRSPPCCCLCFCCPTVTTTSTNLLRLELLVLQTSFIQPVVAYVSMVLWLDDKYNPEVTKIDSVSPYLSIVSGVSTIVAMYGLIVIYRSTRVHLKTHSITPKFLVLQMALIVEGLQKFILQTMASFNVPPCAGVIGPIVRAYAFHHMLVIGEMFLLAFLARIVYRRPAMQEMAEGYRKISFFASTDEDLERRLDHVNAEQLLEEDEEERSTNSLTRAVGNYNSMENTQDILNDSQ